MSLTGDLLTKLSEANAEIERLRTANEMWASAYHAEYYANVKLRAALEQIAEGSVSDHPPTLWAFARAALGFTPVPNGQPAQPQEEA